MGRPDPLNSFKEKTPLRNMEDKKQCSKCKAFQPLQRYTEGRIQCNVCLEQKRRYREKHRDELRERAKQYYKQNRGEICEKQTTTHSDRVECPLCKCMVGKYRLKQHEQTFKHQMKIKTYKPEEVRQNREAWVEQHIL